MEGDNDNERLSFVSLAALTANVTRYLRPEEQKDVPAERDGNSKDRQEERNEAQRAYIEQRLKDTIAFERRFKRKN